MTPAYYFDLDAFRCRCKKVKEFLSQIPLTYSMKANPFLLQGVSYDTISHIEVCSPGELHICKQMGVPAEKIIYSGVNKEAWDVKEAVDYGVDLLTAESKLHVKLENEAVCNQGGEARKVILRLTSGNQFGMSETDIAELIAERDSYPGLDFYGIHYYSGTQKKMRQIKKDFKRIEKLLDTLKENYSYEPRLIEYGPGASVDYFEAPYDETDWQHFSEVCQEIKDFANNYPVGIEMGRFLASDCGHYVTQIKDSKENQETNYLICDGGIHHLRYFGQTMAMQIPPIDHYHVQPSIEEILQIQSVSEEREGEMLPYMVCGSLCTTADILVREVLLPPVEMQDYLVFHRCGAYSVTEGTALFLSRTMPRIWVYDQAKGPRMIRDYIETSHINSGSLESRLIVERV